MILDIEQYAAGERVHWKELEAMLDAAESDPFHEMSLEQIERFYMLYRRAGASLATLQSYIADPAIAAYLEQLLARAYALVYSRNRSGRKVHWFSWFIRDVPRVFRKHLWAFGLSSLVTFLGGLFGVFLLSVEPELKTQILPFGHGYIDPAERVQKEEAAGDKHGDKPLATFSAFLMRNNISVSFRAMAMGLTFGIGTLALLFYNGVMLGGICLDYVAAGQSVFLAGWLLPHGSFEIPAILIAGQVGFVIAGTLVGRGRGSLAARFRAVRYDIACLIGGVCVLLIWAGIVEAFFSQYHEPILPYWAKIAFGCLQLVLLTWFLLGNRRKKGGGSED